MITVEIDNEEYQLPTSWDDITLREFKNILDFEKSRDYNSDLKKSVDLMALLMKCDSDKILYTTNRFKFNNSRRTG